MNQVPEHVGGETITIGDWVACAALALLLGLIAWAQFEDRHVLDNGTKVESTIETVSPSGKSGSAGWIDYRLPDGVACRDWTELAPRGDVHPGEPLTVAVGGTCGHAVSTKKRLWPWAYLLASLGFALHPLFRLWRSHRRTMPSSTVT
uniref:Protein of unassigned function n=1 Tax=Methylobacterium oryzae CBMB20 TaxID=693986 RepID=A0A088B3D5_9HYPH|nr:hypothetical protein [Methylobacterium oryzae]AGO88429.1 protein of unassigned function [Methylobacterium oryzae CBMB20]